MSEPEGERRREWVAGRIAAARPLQDGAMRLSDGIPMDPESVSRMLGDALAELHATSAEDSSFPVVSPEALRARAHGRVDIDAAPATEGPYRGIAPARLLEILDEQLGGLDDDRQTVVHGALTASDVWIHPEAGLVLDGWDGVAIGDPHLDLAVGAGLLGDTYGYAVAGPFFDAYGLDKVDALRLDTFQLLAHMLRA